MTARDATIEEIRVSIGQTLAKQEATRDKKNELEGRIKIYHRNVEIMNEIRNTYIL